MGIQSLPLSKSKRKFRLRRITMHRALSAALWAVLLFLSLTGSRLALAQGGLQRVNHITGKPLVRQLLWGSGLRSRQPLSQREWRLPTKRSQVRRWFVVHRGRERQPDLLELKSRRRWLDGSGVSRPEPMRHPGSRPLLVWHS